MNLDMDLKTLGLSPGASWEDVKSAFRRLARTYHPDVAGPEHSVRFAEINRAYMSIREAVQRGTYGACGSGTSAGTSSPFSGGTGTYYEGRTRRRARSRRPSRGIRIGGLGWLSSLGSAIARGASAIFNQEERRRRESERRAQELERIIGEAMDLAGNRLDGILRRSRPAYDGSSSPHLETRLFSRHPGVVVLAMEELRRLEDRALAERLMGSLLSRGVPDGEVLKKALGMFRPACSEVARAICRWGASYGREEAVSVIRWLKYGGARDRALFKPFCSSQDPVVLVTLLDAWPMGCGLPDVSDMSRFLKFEDEHLLGAALRLIKREGPQGWMMPRLERLASSHGSAAVRVWASAIVRTRPME